MLLQPRQAYLAFITFQRIFASIAAAYQPQRSYNSLTPRLAQSDTFHSLENANHKRDARQEYSLQRRAPTRAPMASDATMMYYSSRAEERDSYDLVIALDPKTAETIARGYEGNTNTWWATIYGQHEAQQFAHKLGIDESAIRIRVSKISLRETALRNSALISRACVIFSIRKPVNFRRTLSAEDEMYLIANAIDAIFSISAKINTARRLVNDPVAFLSADDRQWVSDHIIPPNESLQGIDIHEPAQIRPSRHVPILGGSELANIYHYHSQHLEAKKDYTVTAVLCPMMNEVIRFRASGSLKDWWEGAEIHDWFTQALYDVYEIPKAAVGLYPTLIQVANADAHGSTTSPRICIILRIPKYSNLAWNGDFLLWLKGVIGALQRYQLNVLIKGKRDRGLFVGNEEATALTSASNAAQVQETVVSDPLAWVGSGDAIEWANRWLETYASPPAPN